MNIKNDIKRKPVTNVLNAEIDWHYYAISELNFHSAITLKELHEASISHLKHIIKKKTMLGYDTTADKELHNKIVTGKGSVQ